MRRIQPVLYLACVVIAALAVSACGSSSGSGGSSASKGSGSVKISVGGGKTVTLTKPLKIAYFVAASSNALGSSQEQFVNQFKQTHDLNITTFDAAFDANTQFDQIQSAIESHRYNVLAVWPVDGENICKILDTTAPAQNILVTDFDQPLCGRFVHEGQALWQPGTLNYISGYNTRTSFRQWFEAVAAANPGPQNVGVLEGVITDGDSQDVALDMSLFKTQHPNFHFLSRLNTTYTAETGYQQALAMLHAHPNINLLVCDASAITQGAAKAVQQLGLTGKVKIADYGGSHQVAALIKQGVVELTVPAEPKTEGMYWLTQLMQAAAGKTVPRFTPIPFEVITKANVNSYKAQY